MSFPLLFSLFFIFIAGIFIDSRRKSKSQQQPFNQQQLDELPLGVIHIEKKHLVYVSGWLLDRLACENLSQFEETHWHDLQFLLSDAPLDSVALNLTESQQLHFQIKPAPTGREQSQTFFFEEITAVQHEISKLKQQNQLNQRIINASFDVLLSVDADGKITWVSQQATPALGYDKAALTGQMLQSYIHPDDQKVFNDHFQDMQVDDIADIQYLRLRNKLKIWQFFRCKMYKQKCIDTGQSIYHLALHDEHVNILAERSLRNSESRYRSLIENFPELILQVDFDDQITYANPALKSMTGYSPDAAYSSDFLQYFIAPESFEAFGSHLKIARKGQTTQVGINFTTLEKKTRNGTATVLPLYDSGLVKSLCVIIRDITNEMILQEQLNQSQKMESIGTLARGIAHDFNNSLTGIVGNASILREILELEEFPQSLLDEIEKSADRCTNLTRSLLAFSRHDKTRLEPTDLNGLLQSILLFARRIFPSTILINAPEVPDLNPVLIDQSEIQQVFMNLLINARDAIQKRSGSSQSRGIINIAMDEVTIDNTYSQKVLESSPGKYIKISIEDDGVGIPEHVISSIYDPFFSTKEVGQGTGLGLSVVFGILKAHNGWIEVESSESKGTNFYFFLPTLEERMNDSKDFESMLEGHGETVLVVDDEEIIRNFASKSLEQYGYHTLTATNGEEALQTFNAHVESIDLLLVDLTMPGIDGRVLIKKIQENKPEIRAILSSGYDSHYDEFSENTRFLPKPYIARDLARLVHDLLDERN